MKSMMGMAVSPFSGTTPIQHFHDSVDRIDFLSDVHLTEKMPRTAEKLFDYLGSTPAKVIIILGDLFEVWLGDDTSHQSFNHRCIEALAGLAPAKQLFLMHGNRDFLLGDAFAFEVRGIFLNDPTVLCAFGQRLLCTHGDAWCTSDLSYQAFRRQVRNPAWQANFLALPLQTRTELARKIRSESMASQANFSHLIDIDTDFAQTCLAEAGVDWLVHGHTHQAGDQIWATGAHRQVLSDWDFDATPHRGDLLVWTASGMTRQMIG